MKRVERVKKILEDAVGGATIGQHGNFWRTLTADQFKTKKVFGMAVIAVGKPDESNLIKALEGRAPFDGSPDGYPRMPKDLPVVSPDNIGFIRQWIADGCLDDEESVVPGGGAAQP
jgi:hypothetical protein